MFFAPYWHWRNSTLKKEKKKIEGMRFRHISIYMDKKESLVCGQWWARTFWSTCCNRTRPLWAQFTPERLRTERSLQKPLKPLLQVFSRRLLLRRLLARRFPQDLTLPLYPSVAHSITHSLSLSVSPSLSFVAFSAHLWLCVRSEAKGDRPERRCDGEGGDVGSPAAEK